MAKAFVKKISEHIYKGCFYKGFPRITDSHEIPARKRDKKFVILDPLVYWLLVYLRTLEMASVCVRLLVKLLLVLL